jgi:hypothetical protein
VSGEANTSSVTAGPVPGPGPTATVDHGQQTHSHPAGSAMPEGGIPITERPEALVGAAFAGGLAFALILKRLVR